MAVADLNQEAKLIELIGKTFQECMADCISTASVIEEYLSEKYKCDIEDIEVGQIYESDEKGLYIYVPACKLEITAASGDLQAVGFLKDCREFTGNLNQINAFIEKLPASARDLVTIMPQTQAQAKSLLRLSESELSATDKRFRQGIAANITKLITNLKTIEKYANELIALAAAKAA